jgi:hypothetical protein
VLLRAAADPSLPPITCPRSAAQQCGELMRLLEVLEEAHPEGSSSAAEAVSSHQQPELALLGVAAEEHAALQQLVRCLVGETHAGLLEASQLLDVTRWGSSGHCLHGLTGCGIPILNCLWQQCRVKSRHRHRLVGWLSSPQPASSLLSLPPCCCRLADLLDAGPLLAECLAVLECILPGPEMYAPLLALAEARQYNRGLQRLKASSRGRQDPACNSPA